MLRSEVPTPLFSCKSCKIFKCTYLKGHLRTAAFEGYSENIFEIMTDLTVEENVRS